MALARKRGSLQEQATLFEKALDEFWLRLNAHTRVAHLSFRSLTRWPCSKPLYPYTREPPKKRSSQENRLIFRRWENCYEGTLVVLRSCLFSGLPLYPYTREPPENKKFTESSYFPAAGVIGCVWAAESIASIVLRSGLPLALILYRGEAAE